MKKTLITTALASSLFAIVAPSTAQAESYKIDVEGAHAFV